MLEWYTDAGTVGGTCLEESLSSTPNHSLLPVWTATSALCVKIKRTFFSLFLGQIRGRRRYDPAATRPLSAIAPSLLTARLPERREGSHLRAAVQFVAVAGIRISFQLLAEIPGIFFPVLVPPSLCLKVISPLVAQWLRFFFYSFSMSASKSVFGPLEKRHFTTVRSILACWHTFRRPIVFSGATSAGPMV